MKTCERVRLLRLDLHLTQTEFGARLGVGRDVIKRIERNEFIEQNKRSLFKLMAKEFNVSEAWLLYGEASSPEYASPLSSDCHKVLTNSGATAYEAAFISSYLTLDSAQREVVLDNLLRSIQDTDDILRRQNREAHEKKYI